MRRATSSVPAAGGPNSAALKLALAIGGMHDFGIRFFGVVQWSDSWKLQQLHANVIASAGSAPISVSK
jgi:hypothetical protein